MASNVLRLVFKNAAVPDKKVNYNFTYAKATPAEADVKALGAAMVANKEIFDKGRPGELVGAEVIITTTTPINVTP